MGFVTDYSGFTLTFLLVLLTLYFGITHMLHWYFSHFSLAFTHRLLQVYSLFTSSLLTICSGFLLTLYSRFTLSLLRVYSHFTTHFCPDLHTLESTFYHSPCLPTLNCKSPQTLLLIYTHFATFTHTLHQGYSYLSLGFTHTLV